MKLQDEQQANQYMRRLREAYHSDDLPPRREVLFDLAQEFVIDQKQFQSDYDDGTARAKLNEDIQLCRQAGVQGFPTVMLEYGDKRAKFSGYIAYDRLVSALEDFTDGAFKCKAVAFTEENVVQFAAAYRRAAMGELKLLFNASEEAVNEMVDKLVKAGRLQKEVRGTSYFVTAM